MENMMFGEGADELLEILYKAFVEKDDEVIFADPSFVEYGRNSLLMGAKGIKIPLGLGLKHDLKAMSAAITSKTKIGASALIIESITENGLYIGIPAKKYLKNDKLLKIKYFLFVKLKKI